MAASIQFQKSMSPVIPRFSVMFVNFLSPGIFLTVMSSLPLRYSMLATSASSPEHSVNEPLTELPSSLIPFTVTRKL